MDVLSIDIIKIYHRYIINAVYGITVHLGGQHSRLVSKALCLDLVLAGSYWVWTLC